MKYVNISLLFFMAINLNLSIGLASTEDTTDAEYEEVSYEDLLGRIANKKSYLKSESTSPFDDVVIHTGLGYVTTFSEATLPNDNISPRLTGIQLTLGINLFNPNWYSEANWRNFGTTSSSSHEVNLRELDFRIGYMNSLDQSWNYKIGTGLSTRFFHYSNPAKAISYDSTTPALMIHFAAMNSINKYVSFGAEISMQSPLTASYDRGGWNLGVLTQGSF